MYGPRNLKISIFIHIFHSLGSLGKLSKTLTAEIVCTVHPPHYSGYTILA